MRLVAWILTLLLLPAGALACGGAEDRCTVEGGYYLAAPPPDWDGSSALPVIVYFHGWNGSPEGVFRNKAMVNAANRRGALFVAPWAATGYWRQIGEGRVQFIHLRIGCQSGRNFCDSYHERIKHII